MATVSAYLWQKAPFLRLFPALAGGIIVQWYAQLTAVAVLAVFCVCGLAVVAYQLIPLSGKFALKVVNGIALTLLLVATGALLAEANDIRNNKNWVGTQVQQGDYLLITLQEPLVEKQNTYRTIGAVTCIKNHKGEKRVTGKVILYFKKDSLARSLSYGAQLLVAAPAEELKNSGNPGGFDFKRYNLFQGITHQIYLKPETFVLLPEENGNALRKFIYASRTHIITILRRYITAEEELGLAEALLIGYKDDLDKNLVQSYSNTGVVHVIAISGLHLALIYGLLLLFTRPLKGKRLSFLRFSIIIAGLWIFAFLAGAQASVLRSAVMFTAIAFSQVLNRKTTIYNTLAMSAFVLLCYNPYWLWDVGFQLSYAAVLSIVIFYRFIYNWLQFLNKGVDFLWKLAAISLAAQILTLPISLYHFHQFPFLFLFANLVAVPLSSLIVYAEIALCLFSFIPPAGVLLGNTLRFLIRFMNDYVKNLDNISFAVWDSLSISVLQTVLLYGAIAGFGTWAVQQNRKALYSMFGCITVFVVLRTVSFIAAAGQQKLIVYNVPGYTAVDLIAGRKYIFAGDKALLENDFLRNFHLQPSRIMHRITPDPVLSLPSKSFDFYGKRIIILDTAVRAYPSLVKEKTDLLILSKNPKIYISNLANALTIHQLVIDGSVPPWKAKRWQQEADSLHLPCYNVQARGAFVINL